MADTDTKTILTPAMMHTESHLDRMASEMAAEPDPENLEEVVPTVVAPEPKVEPKTEPKLAAVTPPAAAVPEAKPGPQVAPSAASPGSGEPPKPVEGAPAVAPDVFDEFKLSPHARPSTAEAFTKVKETARAQISARDTELAAAKQKITEFESRQAVDPLTEDIKAELNTLRAFRESVAIEGDPVFTQKYDAPVQKLDEAILAKLAEAGMAPENVAKVKEIGIGTLDWKGVTDAMPALKPFIDRKLMEREGLQENKAEALKKARSSYDAAVAERREAGTVREKQDSEVAGKTFDEYLVGVPQLKSISVLSTASADEKAKAAAANKQVQEAITLGRNLLGISHTPAGRAETATVAALAHIFKQQAYGAQIALSDEQKAHSATQTALSEAKATLDKVTAELAAIRKSGRILPPGGPRASAPNSTSGPPLNATTQEALDWHAKNLSD